MKRNLRVKILFSVGVIIFVVLGTSTLVHIYDVQQNYLEALEWRSEALAQGLIEKAQELANIAPEFSSNDLLELLGYWVRDVYESNTHLTHIAVIDTEGMIAAHTEKALWDTPIESPDLLDALQRRNQSTVLASTTYHMLFPIRNAQDVYLGSWYS